MGHAPGWLAWSRKKSPWESFFLTRFYAGRHAVGNLIVVYDYGTMILSRLVVMAYKSWYGRGGREGEKKKEREKEKTTARMDGWRKMEIPCMQTTNRLGKAWSLLSP